LSAQKQQSNKLLQLTPILGTVLFIILYFIATLFYPGGSQANKYGPGFSWAHNYWCNLLNDFAINGQPNPAKPIAMAGMLVLCITLALFWIIFPKQLKLNKALSASIQISGILAMSIAILLFTHINHDLITNLASFFGLTATVGTFIGLYQKKWMHLFTFGLFNILLVVINNYFYYNPGLVVYLPVVQKISFLFFLIWICLMSINLSRLQQVPWYRRINKKS
jgi:glucan phosphoethanolaminetransferase (alkaline phosphatase superfamily)